VRRPARGERFDGAVLLVGALRGEGVTIRKTIGLVIGTFCVAFKHKLLHDDRDFGPMERHLGLESAL
jgi:hypothetical protein